MVAISPPTISPRSLRKSVAFASDLPQAETIKDKPDDFGAVQWRTAGSFIHSSTDLISRFSFLWGIIHVQKEPLSCALD